MANACMLFSYQDERVLYNLPLLFYLIVTVNILTDYFGLNLYWV